MDDIEYSGFWWLPSNPESKVAGTLTFSNENGIELRLIGALEGFEALNDFRIHPVIFGLSGSGTAFTLNDCITSSLNIGTPGFLSRSYRARFGLVGGHLSESQLQFKKFAVQYSRLPDWVRTSGLTFTRFDEPKKFEFSYSLPEKIKATTNKGTISINFSFNTKGDFFDEVNLRQSVSMVIDADREYSFQELWLQYLIPFQNFLSFATTKPNSITSVRVNSKYVYFEKSDGSGVVETPMQVIFQQKYIEAKREKLLIPDYMLFTLHDVVDDFEKIMERWLNVSTTLDSVCNLFFGVLYNSNMYLEQEFLNIVQAVESYHRRRMTNKILPKAEHDNRIAAILSRAPSEYTAWLKETLAYSNEPRLKQRILELSDKVDIVLSPLVNDKEEFAKKVKDTRNYLTHYDENLKKKAAQGAELDRLAVKLSYMLQACLLFELGISPEKCSKLFRRNQGYIRAMN